MIATALLRIRRSHHHNPTRSAQVPVYWLSLLKTGTPAAATTM